MVDDSTLSDDNVDPLVNPEIGPDGEADGLGLDPDPLDGDDSVLDEDPAGWN